jgi:hypothetical protein
MSFLHPEIAGHQYILHLVHTKTQRSIFECEDDICGQGSSLLQLLSLKLGTKHVPQ